MDSLGMSNVTKKNQSNVMKKKCSISVGTKASIFEPSPPYDTTFAFVGVICSCKFFMKSYWRGCGMHKQGIYFCGNISVYMMEHIRSNNKKTAYKKFAKSQ